MNVAGLRASSTLIRCLSKSIISRWLASASIPIRPSPPRSTSRNAGSSRSVTVLGPSVSCVDQDPIDDVAVGHAVEDRRRAERKLQVARDAQADHRSVGAAVDDEAIGPAAVDQHIDAEAGVDLARLDLFAADRERRCRSPRAAAAAPVRAGRAEPASAWRSPGPAPPAWTALVTADSISPNVRISAPGRIANRSSPQVDTDPP